MPPFSKANQPKHRSKRIDQMPGLDEPQQPDRVGVPASADLILDLPLPEAPPPSRVERMAERLKYSVDTGPYRPFPEDDTTLSLEEAESNLFQTQENAVERRKEIQTELAQIDAAVLLARRDLDAAKDRARLAEQKERARSAPRRLAESKRVTDAEDKEREKVRLSEANVVRERLLKALEPVRRELVGVQALCEEWLAPLRRLDSVKYRDLPEAWSAKGKDIIARQRGAAYKLTAQLIQTHDGMKACIRDTERIAELDAPRTADQRTVVNEALTKCKYASSGHTAFFEKDILSLFSLVNETIESEGGLNEDEAVTVAPLDPARQQTAQARIAHIKKTINPFAPKGGNEPQQTRAADTRDEI